MSGLGRGREANEYVVLVTQPVTDEALELLREVARVTVLEAEDDAARRRELRGRLPGVHALLCSVTERVDAAVVEAADSLRLVANMAVGYDNIDVRAMQERGIVVTNTPDVLTDTTADFAVGLMLAAMRRIPEADRFVRSDSWQGWQPNLLVGRDLFGRTVGIAGLGRIGGAVAKRLALGFGCRILYTSRRRVPWAERELAAERVQKEELLERSEVLSLHLPATEETRYWIDAGELAALRPDAVLINTSRGSLLRERALVATLAEGRLSAVGLDVFEDEPRVSPELLNFERVVLAPHIGSASKATRAGMAMLAARNVVAVLGGGEPLTPVKA